MDIQEKLNRFFEEIQKEDFLQMRGLGNEVPYFIFDYKPEDELFVRQRVKHMLRSLPFKVNEVNLLQAMISLFEDIGLEELKQFEEDEGTDELFEAIRPTIEEEALVRIISDVAIESQLVFITGIGSVYKLIRAHELLNQLHAQVTNTPIILFYPGVYTGQGLKLFNEFETNGYYRAFEV